jgi:serine/threonine protein kinase
MKAASPDNIHLQTLMPFFAWVMSGVCLRERVSPGQQMASMDDGKKDRFGRYEILSEIGRGAMGIVYKARDPKINRVVAVKTISLAGQPAEDEREYRERFFREAEAAGRLSHPGIVTVFDIGEEPETRTPYIVMEFVAGQSLEKLLLSKGDRKLPPEEALQLTLEVAEALDCAHSQGVVHRDVKPANILLTPDGHAKIADFGVAKLNLANATVSGRTLGTPAYMSPEQLNGEGVDGRSDLFSLGVILYTIVTGYKPFQGNSALTVAFKIVNRDPVPATVLDTELPSGFDYIISRAIAKDRSQRYQRGMEMVRDIQEVRAGREPWSEAKEPGSAGAIQTESERARSSSNRPLGVVSSRRSNTKIKEREHGAVVALLEQMRNKYFAGAVLLIGLLVVALRASQFIWPKGVFPGNLGQTKIAAPPVAGGGTGTKAAPEAVKAISEPHASRAAKPSSVVASRATSGKEPHSSSQAPPISPAMLEIEVAHKFAEAQLSIWVDENLSFTHQLEGSEKKHLVVFHRIQGHEFHAVQIAPGKHRLRVQVSSGTDNFDQSASVEGDFAAGAEKMLRVQFSKNGQMSLTLQ